MSLHLERAGSTTPSVHGHSVLGALELPSSRAGVGGLFDSAYAVLREEGEGEARRVVLRAATPEDGETLALGRQHELWRELPGIQARLGIVPDPGRPVRCAAVVVVADESGAVLLTRRAACMRSYPGCWVLPGGAVDAGESLVAAAAREVLEETGLVVDASTLRPVAAWESAFPLSPAGYEAARGLKVHTIMVAYAGRVGGRTPPLRLSPQEVDVCCWVSPEHLPQLLDGTLSAAQLPAACIAPEGTMHVRVEAAQLCGVYPNLLSPPEGLGLAHHFVLGRWLDSGRP